MSLFRSACRPAVLLLVLWVSLAAAAQGREQVAEFSIEEALQSSAAKRQLSGNTQFYFGRQTYPDPSQTFGTYRTQKRTNTSEKSARDVCISTFVSALAALADRAQLEGGNAVVDIASTYDDHVIQSRSEFQCGTGKVMAGVALQGRVVTLPGQAPAEAEESSEDQPDLPRKIRLF